MSEKNDYEVVGIFSSVEALNQAVDELFIHGFDQSSLSVLASEEEVQQQLGKNYNKIDDLADDAHTARTAFYAEENISIAKGIVIGGLMYIGTVTIAGIIIIGGRAISSALVIAALAAMATVMTSTLLVRMITNPHEKYLKKQIKKGGLLLWVHLKNEYQKDMVAKVLQNNNARNVHLHRLPTDFYKS